MSYAKLSNCPIEQAETRVKVDIPMTLKQAEAFRKFLKSTGRKQGPYVGTLVLKDMETRAAIESSSTQIDVEALR